MTPPIAALNLEGGAPCVQFALTPPSTPQPQTFSHDVTPASSQESQNPFILDHNSGSFLLPPDMNDPASTLLSQIFAPGTFPNLHASWAADHHIDFGHDLSANLEYVPPWDDHGRSFNASININVGVTSMLPPSHRNSFPPNIRTLIHSRRAKSLLRNIILPRNFQHLNLKPLHQECPWRLMQL